MYIYIVDIVVFYNKKSRYLTGFLRSMPTLLHVCLFYGFVIFSGIDY